MAAQSSRQHRAARDPGKWFFAGYAGIAGFVALEALARQPGAASSLEASSRDQGTTRMIITAYACAAELPLLLRYLPLPPLPKVAGPAGLVIQAGGLVLRAWSMRTLGAAYTRTLRTNEQQRVIDHGPYRLVRHPGYSGSLLTWTGFALASRSAPVIVLVSLLLGRAYQRRINAEEQLLNEELPGYGAYSQHTKKLIPFLW